MAAKLKLCLMVHVEDGQVPTWGAGLAYGSDPLARALGTLAGVIAPYGGKLSVQSDITWLRQNGEPGQYHGGPTSLQAVLTNGGNLWCQTHCTTAAHLTSVWACVASAHATELTVPIADATTATAGRSGGASLTDPTVDWVAIAVGVGIKRMNSTVDVYYSCMPQSVRPYEMSNGDIKGVWAHDAAPGPIAFSGAPTTMRQRPFWVSVSSAWDASGWNAASGAIEPGLNTIYPNSALVGSLLMIPHVGREALGGLTGNRWTDPTRVDTVTIEDMDAALTQVHSTAQQMMLFQNSISNVWYIHVRPSYLAPGGVVAPNIATYGAWVQSITAMASSGGTSVGTWMNMNEITTWYVDPRSAWY